jgi:hypothetical protein
VDPAAQILDVLPDMRDILVDPETRILKPVIAPALAEGNRTRRQQ